jgi:glycosyltransferase involved in cell wall biosynthesis
MADVAAGAEVQLSVLLAALAKMPELELSAILFNNGPLAADVRRLGIKTQVIPESEHNLFSIFKQLRHYFGRHPVDILHTHKYKDNMLGGLASLGCGVRARVRTIHGAPEPFVGFGAAKMTLYEGFDHCVNRWLVDRIIAVSLDLQNRLVKQLGTEKVTCIHNAVDTDAIQITGRRAELRRELNFSEDDFVIGTMGRIVPVKGFDSFLRAARIIRKQRSNAKFVIVGDGPLKASLQALSHACCLDNDVLFLGHRGDAPDVLQVMNLFVLPSLSEGIPMVLLEALALARPVVATRVGGIPEVIEDGASGLLVNPGSDEELADRCITLMDDDHLARRLGIAGRKQVEERFSARVMAEKVAELYGQLAGAGRG